MSEGQEMVYRTSNWRGAKGKKVHKTKDCFHLRESDISEHPHDSMPDWIERCDHCWGEDECEECGSTDTRKINPFLTYCRECEQTFNPNPRWAKKDTEPFANE